MPALCCQPFFTPIVGGICVGSLPLASDVEFLASRGVVAVFNMCREYSGPVEEYNKHGIVQHWFPTSDLSEPTCSDIEKAVTLMEERKLEDSDAVLFVHCKGGRGRAVCIALCFLVKQGMPHQEAAELIKQERHVADVASVLQYSSVNSFISKYGKVGDSNYER